MSAALTMKEKQVLLDAVSVFALTGATDRGQLLADLANRLFDLRFCDGCGVLFDDALPRDECHRCTEDRQRDEFMEARGGQL